MFPRQPSSVLNDIQNFSAQSLDANVTCPDTKTVGEMPTPMFLFEERYAQCDSKMISYRMHPICMYKQVAAQGVSGARGPVFRTKTINNHVGHGKE